MLRIALAVIAAYAAIVILIILMNVAFVLLWPDAFPKEQQGPYTGPDFILYIEIMLSVLFALAGGVVATVIGGKRAAVALAVVMVLMGIFTIVGEQGIKPMWSIAATVIAGPAGVLLGSRLRSDRPRGGLTPV